MLLEDSLDCGGQVQHQMEAIGYLLSVWSPERGAIGVQAAAVA